LLRALLGVSVGLAHALDQLAVARGVGGILISAQTLRTILDDLLQALATRRLDHLGRGQLLHRGQVVGGTPAPEEGLLIELHRHAVEFNGLIDGLGGDGNQTLLIRETKHKQVGGDAVAEQAGSQAGGVDELGLGRADGLDDGLAHGGAGHLGIRVAGELGGGRLVAVDQRMGDLVVELGQGLFAGGSPTAHREAETAKAHRG